MKTFELYHGSDYEFNNFITGWESGIYSNQENNIPSFGVYFTDNKKAAQEYGSYIYTCNIEATKILNLDNNSDAIKALDFLTDSENNPEHYHTIENMIEENKEELINYIKEGFNGLCDLAEILNTYPQILQNVICQGSKEYNYDMVIMEDNFRGTESISYIVLDTNNITIKNID